MPAVQVVVFPVCFFVVKLMKILRELWNAEDILQIVKLQIDNLRTLKFAMQGTYNRLSVYGLWKGIGVVKGGVL